MKIVFIGTKGEIEEESVSHRLHTSTAFDNLVIDWGTGHTEQELEAYKPEAVLITHLHLDHYSAEALGKFALETYVPEECLKGELKASSLINVWKGLNERWIAGFKVKPYPVLHSLNAPTVGYLLEKGGKRVFYSPDFLSLRKAFHNEVFKGLDLWVSDGSSVFKPLIRRKDSSIYGHLSMAKTRDLAERYGVKNLIFTHLGKEAVSMGDERLKRLGFNVAKDGQVLQV